MFVTPIVGFCFVLPFVVHFTDAILLMGKRGLFALLSLSSWCLVIVVRLFLAVPGVCPHFVIVVFPDHTHLLFVKVHRNYIVVTDRICHYKSQCKSLYHTSQCMRFPTMWYVRPAKPQISLRIRAVLSELLLVH